MREMGIIGFTVFKNLSIPKWAPGAKNCKTREMQNFGDTSQIFHKSISDDQKKCKSLGSVGLIRTEEET
jgi:hypothetical protein